MARMILLCGSCSAQNFVSSERGSVTEIPPRCWKCGETLPRENETGSDAGESYKGARPVKSSGSTENA
jgi:hypothetical protein